MPNHDPGELHDALAVALNCPPDATADDLWAAFAALTPASAIAALGTLVQLATTSETPANVPQ